MSSLAKILLSAVILASPLSASASRARVACRMAANDNEPNDDVLAWAQSIRELREQLADRLDTTRDPKRIMLTADETRLLLTPALRTLTKLQLSANEKTPSQLLARAEELRFEILAIIHGATLESVWQVATEAAVLNKALVRANN